jgi:hypothetical protein
MSKLKSWRCEVHIKSYIGATAGTILLEENIIVVVQAEKPGQASMKIINIFEGGQWIATLSKPPVEIVGLNQLQLFTT